MNRRVFIALVVSFAAAVGGSQWYSNRQIAAARSARASAEQVEAACRGRLDESIDLHGECLSLDLLADLLARITSLEVQLDAEEIARALEGQYFTYYRHLQFEPTSPGKFKLQLPVGTMPLGDALALALEPYGLTCEVRGQTLVVTSLVASHDRTKLRLAVYPMPRSGPIGLESEAWAGMLESQVDPSTWKQFGGQGHLEQVSGGAVVVQTAHEHRRLERLLSDVSKLESPATTSPRQPVPFDDNQPADRRVRQALAAPSSLICRNRPLAEVLADLSARHNVPIFLNASRLNLAGMPLDAPVTVEIDGQPLEAVLRSILDPQELEFTVRRGAIVATTPIDNDETLQATAYPIGDLIPDRSPQDFARLLELITSIVAPQSWDEVGGPGTAQPLGTGWFLVSQTSAVHEELDDLLDRLRRGLQGSDGLRIASRHESPAIRKILTALNQPVALEFDDVPLEEVCARLSQQAGITILLNRKKLDESGMNPRQRVTWHLPAAPLKIQLDWLLDELNLAWNAREEFLQITTPEDAEAQHITEIYDVRPLVDADFGILKPDELIGLLYYWIAPQSWDEVGGPGTVYFYRGLLVVSQSSDVHSQLELLLAALGSHCLQRFSPAAAPHVVRVEPSPAADRIESLLRQPARGNYCDSLEQVLMELSAAHDLPIVVNRRALDFLKFAQNDLVFALPADRTLAGVLDELLIPVGLSYSARNHVLLITSSEDAHSALESRLYWIAGLAPPGDEAAVVKLLAPLTAIDDPQRSAPGDPYYWEERGGPGQFHALRTGWLLVSADWDMHQQLVDWLEELRTGHPTARSLERTSPRFQTSPKGATRRAKEYHYVETLYAVEVLLNDSESTADSFLGYPPLYMRETTPARPPSAGCVLHHFP